jgi:hypothetical protein
MKGFRIFSLWVDIRPWDLRIRNGNGDHTTMTIGICGGNAIACVREVTGSYPGRDTGFLVLVFMVLHSISRQIPE